jgi:hypothetical protein
VAKRPKSVKVGPFTYLFHYTKEIVKNAKGDDLWGQCDNEAMVIRVCPGQSNGREACTVMHESLHAMFAMACPHMEEEERIVTQLAPVLMKFIKDNPKFMEYIKNA